MNARISCALLGALSLCAAAVATATPPQYALVDLGSAQVPGAGLSWQQPGTQIAPTNWPAAGGATCLGQAPINYIGAQFGDLAVGATCEWSGGTEAATWNLSGSVTLTVLGMLPNAGVGDVPHAGALDYNNLGDIVGYSNSSYETYIPQSRDYAIHGFIYNSGNWTELIPIAGTLYNSSAAGINDSREVVGQTETISSATGEVLQRAFIYSGGTMYNLTFYLVGGPTVLLSDAYGIDCQGNISAVGTSAAGGGTPHSYLLVRQGAARANCPQ